MSSCCAFNPSLSGTSSQTSSSSSSKGLRQRCFSFSEDGRFFAVGTTDGFIIYCTEPFVPLTVRETGANSGGVSLISMFARSNLLLLVCPANPRTVLLWNEALSPPAVCGEVSFHSEVMAVRLHQAMIVIADSHGVHCFSQKMVCSHSFQYNEASRTIGLPSLAIAGSAVCSTSSMQNHQFYASNNNNGDSVTSSANSLPTLLMMNQQQQQGYSTNQQQQQQNSMLNSALVFPLVLACPITLGSLLIVLIDNTKPTKPKVLHRRSVPVHNKAVQICTFSQNGKFVASCSTGGTAIKLTHVQTGNVLMQFNRGATPNQIHSLAFAGLSYIACVSGTGSVHLFAVIDKVRKMLEKIDDDEEDDHDQENTNDENTTVVEKKSSFEDLGDAAVLVKNNAAKASNKNRGVFGFFRTLMQSTTDFHEGVWACGHFDMLQLHPSAAKRALFGPAICCFLSDGMSEDDGSLKFLVAHGESGKIGKVNFSPNDSAAERNAVQQHGAAVVQSQNAALLQAAMGSCDLSAAWSFPTDAF